MNKFNIEKEINFYFLIFIDLLNIEFYKFLAQLIHFSTSKFVDNIIKIKYKLASDFTKKNV